MEGNWKDYNKVLKLWDDFFQVRQYIFFEWAQFNWQNQVPYSREFLREKIVRFLLIFRICEL